MDATPLKPLTAHCRLLRSNFSFSWAVNRFSSRKKSITSAKKTFSGRSIFFSPREKKTLRRKIFFLACDSLFSVGKNRLMEPEKQFPRSENLFFSGHQLF